MWLACAQTEKETTVNDFMAIEFITTRMLENKSGEMTGKIRILKLKEEPDALVDYTCPACGFNEKRRETWQEPLVSGKGVNKKFLVVCNKCKHEMRFLKLKKETKKKDKK